MVTIWMQVNQTFAAEPAPVIHPPFSMEPPQFQPPQRNAAFSPEKPAAPVSFERNVIAEPVYEPVMPQKEHEIDPQIQVPDI